MSCGIVKKFNLENLYSWGSVGYVHNPSHKYDKLGPWASKHVFIRYPKRSKGYVMYGEHPNRGMTEIESRDVEFLNKEGPGAWLLTSVGFDGVVRRWDARGGTAAAAKGLVAEWKGHRGSAE